MTGASRRSCARTPSKSSTSKLERSISEGLTRQQLGDKRSKVMDGDGCHAVSADELTDLLV